MGYFAKEMKVITKEGSKEVKDLVGVPTFIINGNGKWEEVVFTEQKRQKLCRLNIRQKILTKALFVTANHNWKVYGAKEDVKTLDLKTGQQLSKIVLQDEVTDEVSIEEKPPTHLVTSVRRCNRFEKVYGCVTSTHSLVLDGWILTGDSSEE